MRYLVIHSAIAAGMLAATLTFDSLPGFGILMLWLFGTPWIAGLFALVLLRRSETTLTWIIPATVLFLGLFVLVAGQAVSGMGG